MEKRSQSRSINRKAFLELIPNQKPISDQDEFTKKALEGARQFGNPKRFEGILNRLDTQVEKRTGSQNRRLRKLPQWIGIAATICLIALAGNWWLKKDHRMAISAFEPLPTAIAKTDIQRSGLNSLDEIQEALLLYEQGDFENAIPLFEHALQSNNRDSSILNLYYGISLLGNGNAGEAIEPLQRAGANKEKNVPLQRASSWYLALAYLANGNNEESLNILKTLKKENGDFQKDASELLEKIGSEK